MAHEKRRKALEDLKAELEARIVAIDRDFQRGRSRDSEDQAQERENDDVLTGLVADARAELADVMVALNRLEAGTYGVCSACGEDIDPRRLDSVPEASRCMDCAELAE